MVLTGLSLGLPAWADDIEKNIMTGGPTGTYIKIGQDIAALFSACGQTLTVNESAGSLQNFNDVRSRRNTQFGIVQSDVLEFLKTYEADDPEIRAAIRGVRIAFPLYNEEIHVLARKEIGSLADLKDGRVGIGAAQSGTNLTARLVLEIAGVKSENLVEEKTDESLAHLLSGDLDAFFYVAGAPASLFTDPGIDKARFHLVPMTDPELRTVYVPATIPAGTYPFEPDAVDVVAVKAVLMTFDYQPRRNAYHKASCKAVSDLSYLLANNLDELKQNGHPKWKSVDFFDIPPGWEISPCVEAGLEPGYVFDCQSPAAAVTPGTDRFRTLLKERLKLQ